VLFVQGRTSSGGGLVFFHIFNVHSIGCDLFLAPVVDFEVAALANLSRVHFSFLMLAASRFLESSESVIAIRTKAF